MFLGLSVASNIVAPALDEITRNGLLDRSKESDIGRRQIGDFSIAAPSPDTRVGALSGGNQQKVLFSRWARIADRLLILDEPTRGVDVGAKVEIYRIIRSLADQGRRGAYDFIGALRSCRIGGSGCRYGARACDGRALWR